MLSTESSACTCSHNALHANASRLRCNHPLCYMLSMHQAYTSCTSRLHATLQILHALCQKLLAMKPTSLEADVAYLQQLETAWPHMERERLAAQFRIGKKKLLHSCLWQYDPHNYNQQAAPAARSEASRDLHHSFALHGKE